MTAGKGDTFCLAGYGFRANWSPIFGAALAAPCTLPNGVPRITLRLHAASSPSVFRLAVKNKVACPRFLLKAAGTLDTHGYGYPQNATNTY